MARLTRPVTNEDHHLGQLDAPVTLVEYGDFQCPYCGAAFPVLQQIVRKLGDRLCFVYRHFPLSQEHEYAEAAAEASEAAAAQGKFWEFHNMVFSHQNELDFDHLFDFAAILQLDMQAFEQAMRNHEFQEKVHQEFMSGVRSGVNGTPTLFINEYRYDGPVELGALLQALQEAAETTQA